MRVLIVSALLVKGAVMGLAVHFIAGSIAFGNQVLLVVISSFTTGLFVLGAAIITARSHTQMSARIEDTHATVDDTHTAVEDVKRKLGADQRDTDA